MIGEVRLWKIGLDIVQWLDVAYQNLELINHDYTWDCVGEKELIEENRVHFVRMTSTIEIHACKRLHEPTIFIVKLYAFLRVHVVFYPSSATTFISEQLPLSFN